MDILKDVDGILAYGKEGEPIHVLDKNDAKGGYDVFILTPKGGELMNHHFERLCSALREFANRIDEHYI